MSWVTDSRMILWPELSLEKTDANSVKSQDELSSQKLRIPDSLNIGSDVSIWSIFCINLFCGPRTQFEKLVEKVAVIFSMELFPSVDDGRPVFMNFSDFVLKFNSSKALNETKIMREKRSVTVSCPVRKRVVPAFPFKSLRR